MEEGRRGRGRGTLPVATGGSGGKGKAKRGNSQHHHTSDTTPDTFYTSNQTTKGTSSSRHDPSKELSADLVNRRGRSNRRGRGGVSRGRGGAGGRGRASDKGKGDPLSSQMEGLSVHSTVKDDKRQQQELYHNPANSRSKIEGKKDKQLERNKQPRGDDNSANSRNSKHTNSAMRREKVGKGGGRGTDTTKHHTSRATPKPNQRIAGEAHPTKCKADRVTVEGEGEVEREGRHVGKTATTFPLQLINGQKGINNLCVVLHYMSLSEYS